MKIGYQGMVGSNSEEAAQRIATRAGFTDVEYVPLISSQNVINALKRKKVAFGVMAIVNSITGTVIETRDAIKNEPVLFLITEELQIHHCLFKKNRDISNTYLNRVASHTQALKQTEETRAKLFSFMSEQEIEDTAIGAKLLANGSLPDNTAVICRKNAGEAYGLALVAENIEDNTKNTTKFVLCTM